MPEVSKKFKVGDKVKVVSLQSETHRGECEIGIGDTGVIIDVDVYSKLKYYVESDEGDAWWWEEENLELVKEEETMSEQTTEQPQKIVDVTHKTPYQEEGYTENSLFKFVGDDGQFDKGELIKLHYDDGDDCPDFKSITRDRKRYCCLYEVEYVGEEGNEDMLPDYDEVSKQPSKTEQGIKYDSGKLEYSLIPKGVLTPIIQVLQQGCQKYSKDNWQRVDNPKERYYNALQRHIGQWWEGEKYDSETGENHLAHAACCLMFLLWFDNKDEKEQKFHKDIIQALTKGKEENHG